MGIFFALLLSLPLLIANIVMGYLIGSFIMVVFAATLLSAGWFNRDNRVQQASYTFIFGYMISAGWGLWLDTPATGISPLSGWVQLVLPSIFAGLFLPFWAPLLFAVIDSAVITTILLANHAIFARLWLVAPAIDATFFTYIYVIIFAIAVICAVYARSVEKAVTAADRAAELEQAHAELESTHSDLTAAYAKLEDLAIHDPITGLLNHRALHAQLAVAIEQAARNDHPLAIVFADLDHFKQVNDTWGHPVGDSVLAHLAQCLRDTLRAGDTVARYGGEEFVILLPEQNVMQAQQTAERIRGLVATTPACLAEEQTLSITLSIGVAIFPEDGQTVATILNAADAAMYHAKRNGRNRVCLAADLAIREAA